MGVAFFDFFHGQDGVAPNEIELHPVLSFRCLASTAAPTGAVEPKQPHSKPGASSQRCDPSYRAPALTRRRLTMTAREAVATAPITQGRCAWSVPITLASTGMATAMRASDS
jgi:hypothetical protein